MHAGGLVENCTGSLKVLVTVRFLTALEGPVFLSGVRHGQGDASSSGRCREFGPKSVRVLEE